MARDLITPAVETHMGGYEVDGSVIEFCLKGRLRKGVNQAIREAYAENLARLAEGTAPSPSTGFRDTG